ncbi:MAG: glycosyl hydrolase family 28 protein, partial [Bacteroidota bacterium]
MTTRLVLLVCCSLLLLSATTAQRDNFSVKAHLPHTDKTVNGTRVIQQLIDSCHATGGGTVFFAAGDYLTGSLELKENVFLELAAGATLYGSTKITDYPEEKKASLIYANGANNIGIRGPGTINGQGDNFWRGQEHPITRPDRLILIENGKNVRFSDLTILNSPNWNLEVRFCDGVWIEGITMHAERKAPNTDGIDPVSSSNVFISNCYIDVGDDAICPKSRAGIPVENLVVENCVLISDDAAIKLGTRSEDPIRNCLFSNIIIRNSDYGIAFFNKDGGTFENIRFDNIHIETTDDAAADWTKPPGTYPIFVDLEHRPSSKRAGRPLGKIKNVFFSNITIDAPQGRCL